MRSRRRFASALGGQLLYIAQHALELHAEARCAPFRNRDPDADLPRRIVPDVLRVPAFELGHPVAFLVLMVADDRPTHAR